MTIEMYEVGGCVRDDLLGLTPHDIDYSVVAPSFDALIEYLEINGFKVFKIDAKTLTVRARFPKEIETFAGRYVRGLTADFVLARKEGVYYDGRHPETVVPGTLRDDIMRRDFTVNALAKRADGTIIDLVDGLTDIELRLLRAVGDPVVRIEEDGLRALRAVRFSITKHMFIVKDLWEALNSEHIAEILRGVSVDRRREELFTCFAFDTLATLDFLATMSDAFRSAVFSGGLRLKPTQERVK